jgi:two-component system chemotaxis response regulator CheY
MEILSTDAAQSLAGVTASIARDPRSWEGWQSLRISLKGLEKPLYGECLIWTKSIIESYLGDVKGKAYFCETQEIHILCKDLQSRILTQASEQICSAIEDECGMRPESTVFNLPEDALDYAHEYLEEMNKMGEKSAEGHMVDMLLSLNVIDLEKRRHSKDNKSSVFRHGQPKVLLVEDDPVSRWLVRSTLKNLCQFASAPSANKAFSMYASFKPDIVFLDINLPDNNGYNVLEWIMRNDPGACVVMLSSQDQLDNVAMALQDGAAGFISKPFLKDNLLHYVQTRQAS